MIWNTYWKKDIWPKVWKVKKFSYHFLVQVQTYFYCSHVIQKFNVLVINKIFYMPIKSLFLNFFNYKFWNNKYIWNLKIYLQSYNMHLFCYNFKKSELANNHFNSLSKRETKMISKFEKYKNVDANLLS
jgi:hypothetical protein